MRLVLLLLCCAIANAAYVRLAATRMHLAPVSASARAISLAPRAEHTQCRASVLLMAAAEADGKGDGGAAAEEAEAATEGTADAVEETATAETSASPSAAAKEEEEEEDLLSSAAFLAQKINVLEKELAEIEEKTTAVSSSIGESRDEWLSKRERLATDFDNFKARHTNMTRAAQVDAKVKLITDLLPMLDNFDRARNAIKPEGDAQMALNETYMKMLADLYSSLESQGLQKIPTVGEEFDYNLHMAIQQMPSDEYAEGIVSAELQPGFLFSGKLVRAAYVTVAA